MSFEHSFHPQLNENSENVVQAMREKDNPDGETKERWRELYEYGTIKQKQRKELAEQISDLKDNEILMNNTYRPEIIGHR